MVSNPVEELKRQFTDKYVAVDATRPELARFRGAVGQVKTVNMNGRALVQFMDYHLNTGWYDIDLGCLTVVDAPPKDEAKRAPEKPAAKAAPAAATGEKKKLSPLEMARMQGAGGAAKAAPAVSRDAAAERAPKPPAAEKPAAAPAPAKADRGKMSVADMLAAARANKPGAAAAPAAEAAAAPVAKAPPAAPAPKVEAPKATPAPAPAEPAAGEIKRVDKSTMSIADMIAYCRRVDAN